MDTESDGVAVRGFVSAPGCCRGNRSAQYFFCNGRPIRSRALQAALEQAYKNTAMVGRFPGCALYITLPNGLVDVNVHPTKAEVKFAKEKPVFDGVYYGTLAALGRKSAPQAMSGAPLAPETGSAAPRGDFFRTMDADTFRQTYAASPSRRTGGYPVRDSAPYRAASPAAPKPVSSAPVSVPVRTYTPDIPSGNAPRSPVPAPEAPVSPAVPAAPVKKEIPAPETAETAPEQTVLDEAFRAEPVRYIGEALNVYILLEQGDRLLLIDKHAAHERILFDKMRLNEKPLMPQELLEPQPFNTDPDGAALLEENAALMARLGFELDAFGDTAFLIRAVPAQLDAASAVPLLEELVEKLREGRSLSVSDVWERLAATVACKAAIKGGWVTEREELLSLAEKVLAGEVTHCPHGRPVMAVFTRAELDKRFGRIV